MKKVSLRTRIGAGVLAVGAVLGGGAAADVVTAPSSEAYTISHIQYTRDGFGRCQAFEHRNLNWWERLTNQPNLVWIGQRASWMCP